ncbi:hypothetical protein J6590_100057 [Homalodisca vitripennis]|nr:hypothetical protein J6590_100057 [Homalodisca vitripennis]
MRGYGDRKRSYDEIGIYLTTLFPIETLYLNQEFKKQSTVSRKQTALKTAPNLDVLQSVVEDPRASTRNGLITKLLVISAVCSSLLVTKKRHTLR